MGTPCIQTDSSKGKDPVPRRILRAYENHRTRREITVTQKLLELPAPANALYTSYIGEQYLMDVISVSDNFNQGDRKSRCEGAY